MDYLLTVEPVIGGALMTRLGGQLRFESLMLAIHESHLFVPHIRLDEASGGILIGLSVPTDSGRQWVLFTMDGQSYGVTEEWLESAGKYRLDEELSAILRGEW
jgi:hypothetical protein